MLVGRSGLSPTMVGRADDLGRLRALYDGLARPTAAFVSGEAGVGKTRLLRELVHQLPGDTTVLAGQADQGSMGRPMEVLISALAGRDDVDAELYATVTDRSGRSDDRVFAGIELVHRLVGHERAVVVFEDLHWADSESVTLFERLADPTGPPLLLIGTFRSDALSRRHPAGEMLPRLDRRQGVTHVPLKRLDSDEVGVFVEGVFGGHAGPRTIERLHARSGGNPFFLEELIAAAGEQGLAGLADQPLPWSLAEIVGAQLDDLDERERPVVEAAAVLGHRVSFDLLAAVTGSDEDDLIAALRTLVDVRMMVEDEPDVFGFGHALAREAVEASLLGRERRRLHEAAVDALRATGDNDLSAVANHLHGAGRFDEMVEVARVGSRRSLELGSTYEAFRLAELGLSEADDDLDLTATAAEAAWLSDQLGAGIEHAVRWIQLARSAADPAHLSRALQLRARLAWEVRDRPGAEAAIDELTALLDELPSDELRARAMSAIAQSAMLRDEHDDAVHWADSAIELADRLGLADVRAAALVEKGSVLVMRPADVQEGASILLEAIEESDRIGEHVLAARALNNLLWDAEIDVDLSGVRPWIEQMRDHATRAGYDALSQAGYGQLVAAFAAARGDLAGAVAALAAGRPEEAMPHGRGRWYSVAQAGFAIEAGDLDAARVFTEEAKPPAPQHRMSILGLDINLACRTGHTDEARRLVPDLVAAFEDAQDWDTVDVFSCLAHDVIAAALPDVLTSDDFVPLIDALDQRSDVETSRATGPWTRFVHAQWDEQRGEHTEALDAYQACARSLPRTFDSWPAQRATAMVGAGRCLVALGRTDEALTWAQQAAPLLAGWGGWRVEQLRSLERRLGLRTAGDGHAELTPREREVAALVAEGLSNAAIGRRLYISPKTASVHVSNILAKLGMASRAEVAAWAVREGVSENGSITG